MSDPCSHFLLCRLDLQHRRRTGRRRQDPIRSISTIQRGAAEAVYRQRRAVRHIQDCWKTIAPERVQCRPRSPRVSARRFSPGVHTDYESAAADVYIVALSKDRVAALLHVIRVFVITHISWDSLLSLEL